VNLGGLLSLKAVIASVRSSLVSSPVFHAATMSVEQSVEWADEIGVYFQEMRRLAQWPEPAQLAAVNKYEARYTERLRSVLPRTQRAGVFMDTDPTAVCPAIAGMNGLLTRRE
jgi:hypothetical protein